MDVYIYDQNSRAIGILDAFKSLIWTDRYIGYGDFEIYIPASKETLEILQNGYYLEYPNSDRTMIVETVEITTTAEDGDFLIVSGRSLESLLDRRVVWGQTILSGNFQAAIQTLLLNNVIFPSDATRKIDFFTFVESTDAVITAMTLDETQFFGDNLYDAIYTLCTEKNVGFKVLKDDSGNFTFQLYVGTDRSYDQDVNPYVVFSDRYENLISANYLESTKTLKTVSMVAGEGEGSARKLVEAVCDAGAGTGLSRRESYTDASDISQTTYVEQSDGSYESQKMSDANYTAQLASKGKEELVEAVITKSFESDVDATRQYRYGIDFVIGDITQITNKYDMNHTARITEIIGSYDIDGERLCPTFAVIETS